MTYEKLNQKFRELIKTIGPRDATLLEKLDNITLSFNNLQASEAIKNNLVLTTLAKLYAEPHAKGFTYADEPIVRMDIVTIIEAIKAELADELSSSAGPATSETFDPDVAPIPAPF